MPKITKFDRTTIRLSGLNDKIVAAVSALAAEHGLTVQYGGGSFDDLHFTAKVKFTVGDADAVATAERAQFNQYCAMFGLKPEHFGAQFINAGKVYDLVGLELTRTKFPLKGKRVADGKILLFTVQTARKIADGRAMVG